MKIFYLTSESYIDHSYTVAEEMQKHCEFKVFLQAKEMTEEIKEWNKKFNAEFVKRRRFRNPFSLLGEALFLLRLRRMKPDIVWFNTMTVYQVILADIILKKFMVVMHDVDLHPESPDRHGLLSVKITMALARKKICTASRTQAEIFRQQQGFYPPVFSLPVINYYRDIGNKAEKETGSKVRFFFFGSVEKYKGIETLLDAASLLEQKGLKFSLNIFGKLKYDNEAIREKISSLENVTLTDSFIDYRDIHKIYVQHDVLILPYRQVTQCGPLLIGFSEGVPSICSDLEGFREYVAPGTDGLIFDNTPEGLAAKMEEIINDPGIITGLKKGITENALRKFSMASLAGQYMENFRNRM